MCGAVSTPRTDSKADMRWRAFAGELLYAKDLLPVAAWCYSTPSGRAPLNQRKQAEQNVEGSGAAVSLTG